jgi:small subunit ribosomal protein S16
MLMIRLQRIGKHKRPAYRLVINEKQKDTKGDVLEILGNYDPHSKKFACKEDRIKHWLSVGAQCSATVNNLLITKNIIKGTKVLSWKPKKKKVDENDKKEGGARKSEEGKSEEKPAEEAKPEEKKSEVEEKKEEPKIEEKPVEPKEESKLEEKKPEAEEKTEESK